MPTNSNVPNQRLIDLISEAGFSLSGLAKRVNEAGGREGLDLTYGKGSVGHWKNGHNPPDAVRRIVLTLLTAKLGRPVTAADAGWPPLVETPNPLVHTQAYRGLTDLQTVLPGFWSTDLAIEAATEAAALSTQLSSARLPDYLHQFGRRLHTTVGGRRSADLADDLPATRPARPT